MSENATFTAESIRRIEEQLGLIVPDEYRQVLLAYPFERDSDSYQWDLFGDAEAILKENQVYRDMGFFGQKWPDNYLVIGGDGLGNVYYLDLSRRNSPVFFADHEDTSYSQVIEAEEVAPSVAAWVEQIKKEETLFKAEEQERERQSAERKANKKWWQFWI